MPLFREHLTGALPGVRFLENAAIGAEELVVSGTCLASELDNLNTHRLSWEVGVEFLDHRGARLGRSVVLPRYERGYDWWETTLDGSIPPRRGQTGIPEDASAARVVYCHAGGQEHTEMSYVKVSTADGS